MPYAKLKGTYDIPPADSGFYSRIEGVAERAANVSGFRKVDFPVIEYAEMFARGAGESSDIVVKKEMYVFEDLGKRLIALRPEGTAGAVRLYLENGLSMQGYAAKLFYSGPMFRAEKPQAGRYRQFRQFGFEYLGDGTPLADVELILLAKSILDGLSIKDYTVYINSIGCRECRPKQLEALKAYFAPRVAEMCEDCKKRYETNVMRILDCKEERCRVHIEGAPSMHDSLCEACRDHFETVKRGLEAAGVPYEVDTRLVRGLDYYSRTVFEFKSGLLGAQSTVLAGGRYDYLVREFGGMETPAAGFAIGMERLAMLFEASGAKREDFCQVPDVYVAAIGEETKLPLLGILSQLRAAGISAVTEYRHSQLKKHLKSADAMKARYCLFVGDDELVKGIFTLRNLSDGSQREGGIGEIAGWLAAK
jgi:histidyl-tRNA synthetase